MEPHLQLCKDLEKIAERGSSGIWKLNKLTDSFLLIFPFANSAPRIWAVRAARTAHHALSRSQSQGSYPQNGLDLAIYETFH